MSSQQKREPDRGNDWGVRPLPILGVGIAVIALGVPTVLLTESEEIDYRNHERVSFEEVESIVAKRCQPCHADNPTSDTVEDPPAGVTFEKPASIERLSKRIMVRAVKKKDMPLNNETDMTASERETLGAWVHQGAELDADRIQKASVQNPR